MPSLLINEVFYSLQGEGTRAGLPCVFIRLRGCPLRCAYCDTEYAFTEGGRWSIDGVIAEAERVGPGCALYQVTGGEPLLQPAVHGLMSRLCDAGKTVLLETSGACDIGGCDARVIRVMDLKTPGSGEPHRNNLDNLSKLAARDEVKFVLTDRTDYEWARRMTLEHGLADRVAAVLFSPAAAMAATSEIAGTPGLSLADLAHWVLDDRLPVRVQTQLHKLIWDPLARGV